MKLYYIANARMPNEKAHGIQLAKMCEVFVKNGADLELILPRKRNDITESIEAYYGLTNPIKTKKIPVIDIFPKTRFGFNLEAFSFTVSYFLYLLLKKMRGEGGIIYTIDLDQFSFIAVPFLNMPYFFEVHDAKKKEIRFSFFFKKVSGIIAVNNLIKKSLCETFSIVPQKVLVFPNGIDTKLFTGRKTQEEARIKLGLLRDEKIVLYVGRFYDWKGLEVFAKLSLPENSAIRIYCVGATREDFFRITRTKTMPPFLKFMGEKKYSEIPEWLSAADAFLVTGTKKNEYSYNHTSPMKLFEYMASRRPIIACKTPAITDVVSEKEVFFYEPDNADDLRRTILSIFDNSDEAKKKAAVAYGSVQRFSWDERARSVLHHIKESRI